MEDKAQEAEDAEKRGDTRVLYKITRDLTGTRSASCSVISDKGGSLLTNEDEQRSRWAEHFRTVLNRPESEIQADIQQITVEFENSRKPITCAEIEGYPKKVTELLERTRSQQIC